MNRSWIIASVLTAGLLAAAFAGAALFYDSGWLSLVPPDSDVTDVAFGQERSLYQSAFTAWAAVILLIPVYATVWVRNRGAWHVWSAFWTMSWIAYAVHIYVSAFGFFDGEFEWMTSSTRVSAFWPGMLILIWWLIDAVIALRSRTEGRLVLGSRVLIHLAVLVLFVGGSAVKGETMGIKVLGVALAVVALAALGRWYTGRKTHA